MRQAGAVTAGTNMRFATTMPTTIIATAVTTIAIMICEYAPVCQQQTGTDTCTPALFHPKNG
jgi:hypothetical protein